MASVSWLFQRAAQRIVAGPILFPIYSAYRWVENKYFLDIIDINRSKYPGYLWLSSLCRSEIYGRVWLHEGLPRWLSGKESTCQYKRLRRQGFDPQLRKIPWRRKWQPAVVYLPGKSHGQRQAAVHGVTKSPIRLNT